MDLGLGAAIVTPCTEPWDAMRAAGPVRHCTRCDQPVHDLRRLSCDDAVAVLAGGGCIRAHVTRDGAFVAADGLIRRRKRLRRSLFAAVTALVAVLVAVAWPSHVDRPRRHPLTGGFRDALTDDEIDYFETHPLTGKYDGPPMTLLELERSEPAHARSHGR
jgi:hypothetical protein